MSTLLKEKKIAILATNGFEQSELTETRKALDEASATTIVVSPEKDKITAWKNNNWGIEVPVDLTLANANASLFDALLLPGGVINPDTLRRTPEAIHFIKQFIAEGKPVAAICHGPWLLINAEAVKGHTVTSWPSIKIDLINAGAKWVDQEVVVDGNIITSRKPDDIPAFNTAMIKLFAKAPVTS